jgi:hypothetical protein
MQPIAKAIIENAHVMARECLFVTSDNHYLTVYIFTHRMMFSDKETKIFDALDTLQSEIGMPLSPRIRSSTTAVLTQRFQPEPDTKNLFIAVYKTELITLYTSFSAPAFSFVASLCAYIVQTHLLSENGPTDWHDIIDRGILHGVLVSSLSTSYPKDSLLICRSRIISSKRALVSAIIAIDVCAGAFCSLLPVDRRIAAIKLYPVLSPLLDAEVYTLIGPALARQVEFWLLHSNKVSDLPSRCACS